eukprot:evm.model.scf_3043.1 EVM.evm.TU.scf_3043.1   scf_3043:7207-8593(-)
MVESVLPQRAPLVGKVAETVKGNTHVSWWAKPVVQLRGGVEQVWNNGYLSGVTMAVFFSLANLFGKALEDDKVPALQILSMRAAATLPFLCGFFWLKKTPSILGRRELRHLLALQGFLYGFLVVGEWSSFALIHLADTEAILRASVVFGGLLGWLLKGDPLGWPTLSGMALCVGGTVLISQPPMLFGAKAGEQADDVQLAGLLLALMGAVFGGCQAAVVGLIDKTEGSAACVLWINIGIFILASAIMGATNLVLGWPGPPKLDLPLPEWLDFSGIVVCVLLGELFAIRTFQQLSTALGLSFSNLAVILMAIGGWMFLGEVLSWHEIYGIGLVLIGIAVLSREKKQSRPE